MPTHSSSRILVVDDHPVVRRGFRQLFNEQPGLLAPWEASTPQETFDTIGTYLPDLVLMDITLDNGGAAGLDLIKQLCAAHPDLRVLAVSMHDETLYAQRALAAGAQGYVMKRVPDETLVQAVRQVLGGGVYVSDAVRARLREHPGEEDPGAPVSRLTDRELEVFRLVGRGLAPRHIAERLSVSVKTVESHRRSLKQKLGLDSTAELVRYAVAWRVERGGAEDA